MKWKKEEIIRELAKRNEVYPPVGSGSEVIAKHRQAALRFGFCRFILQNIPVFGKAAVLDPDNIRGHPGNRPADS